MAALGGLRCDDYVRGGDAHCVRRTSARGCLRDHVRALRAAALVDRWRVFAHRVVDGERPVNVVKDGDTDECR